MQGVEDIHSCSKSKTECMSAPKTLMCSANASSISVDPVDLTSSYKYGKGKRSEVKTEENNTGGTNTSS